MPNPSTAPRPAVLRRNSSCWRRHPLPGDFAPPQSLVVHSPGNPAVPASRIRKSPPRAPGPVVALALLGILAATVAPPPCTAIDSRDIYERNFRATCEAPSEDSFLLVIHNDAPTDLDHPYLPIYFSTAVATRPGMNPKVEFVEGDFRITENRKFVETAHVRAGELPAYIDEQMLTPTTRNAGFFRGSNVSQMNFKLCSGPQFVRQVTGRQALVADRLVFRVGVGQPGEGRVAGGDSSLHADPWAFPVLSELVVNSAMAPGLAEPAKESPAAGQIAETWSKRLKNAAAIMPLVRVRCAEPGIYRILPEDLKSVGIEPAAIRLDDLRLIESNAEVPLLILPASGSSSSLGWKALVFYSPGVDFVKTPHHTYWLLAEPGARPPIRIAADAKEGWEADAHTSSTLATRTKTYFEFRNYSHVMPTAAAHARWSWETIPQEEFREVSIVVPGAEGIRGSAKLTVELASVWRAADRDVVLYWNRRRLFEGKVKGNRTTAIECHIPEGTILPGENILAVEFREELKGRLPDSIELTNVVLSWTSALVSADNEAACSVVVKPEEAAGGRSATLRFTGSVNDPAELICLDTQNPKAPMRLVFRRDTNPDGAALIAPATGPGNHAYWFATPETARKPWRIERRDPPTVVAREPGADYIAITIQDFEAQTNRLLELKRREGMRTRIADVEQIYDAFGYGVKSSGAIAEFIKYAYANWTPPRPYFICLVGETSDYLADARGVPSDIQPDLVPNASWGSPESTARGDYPYGYVTGNDFLGDLSIGRISVASAEELKGAIDKIESYQTSPAPGAWRARHLFFTDDEREFQDIADLVIADANSSLSLPTRLFLNEYPYEPYFRIVQRRHSDEATADLLRRMNEGVATAVYFGHGGPNVMSSERLFYLQDIPTLRWGSPPMFLGSASCDTAWLDYPKAPFEVSIGEMMVKIPGRGAIGMFGPVSGASSNMHKILFNSWYRGVVSERLRRTGDIALRAQNTYFIDRNSTFVPDQYVLIGDPSLSLPEPRGKGLDLEVSTSVLLKGIRESVHIKGRTQSIRFGWVDVSLRNTLGNPAVPDQRVRLLDGEFAMDLDVEGQSEPGNLILRADAMNQPEGRWEMGYAPIRVVEPVITVDLTTDPPPTTRFQPGEFSRLIQTVTNKTDHELPRLHIRLAALGSGKALGEKIIDLAPGQQWQESIGGPTPAGINRLELVVGRPGTRGITPIGRSELTVRAPSPTRAAALAMGDTGLEAFPRPEGKGTEFLVHLENISTVDLNNLSVLLWQYTEAKDPTTTITETLPIASIPASSGVTLRMLSEEVHPLNSTVRVLVMVRNDPNSKPTVEMPATVIFERNALILPHINVRVVPDSVSLSRSPVTADETTFLSADVENIGREPVESVLVEAFLNEPWDRVHWIRPRPHNYDFRIPQLLPFQKVRVRLRFDTPPGILGSRSLYIVANSRRQFTEDSFDDNLGRVALLGAQLPNLTLVAKDPGTSPVLVRAGEPQDLYYLMNNKDSQRSTEPTEIAVETSSPGKDWSPVTTAIPLRSIGPGRTVEGQARWIPKGQETLIRVTANPSRSYLESAGEDNQVVYPVLSQVDSGLESVGNASDPEQGWSQRSIFHLTVFDQAETRPTGGVTYKRPRAEGRNADRFGAPLSSEGVRAIKPGEPQAPAGEWTTVNGSFSTPATGQPPELAFHLDRPDPAVDYYDCYIQVPSSRAMPDGKAMGKLLVKFGEEREFRLLNGIDEPGWWCYAGRQRIPTDGISVVFAKPKEEVYSGANGYLLLPAAGRLTSPAIRFPANAKPFHARIEGDVPDGTRIALFGRWGRLDGAEMKWNEWQTLAQLPATAGADTIQTPPGMEYFQWEAKLYPTPDRSPELSDIVLVRP